MRKLSLALAGLYLASPLSALADSVQDNLCRGAGGAVGGAGGCKGQPDHLLTNKISNITDALLIVAGSVAVIIIIIGGITYVLSQGDATRTKQAKDTILYAVIGVVVTIMAYAIVHYVSTNV